MFTPCVLTIFILLHGNLGYDTAFASKSLKNYLGLTTSTWL